jgi:hypothetical protein
VKELEKINLGTFNKKQLEFFYLELAVKTNLPLN